MKDHYLKQLHPSKKTKFESLFFTSGKDSSIQGQCTAYIHFPKTTSKQFDLQVEKFFESIYSLSLYHSFSVQELRRKLALISGLIVLFVLSLILLILLLILELITEHLHPCCTLPAEILSFCPQGSHLVWWLPANSTFALITSNITAFLWPIYTGNFCCKISRCKLLVIQITTESPVVYTDDLKLLRNHSKNRQCKWAFRVLSK